MTLRKLEVSERKIILLTWPYTLPGDVISTIYISALYTTPGNGVRWQNRTFYPTGSIVPCTHNVSNVALYCVATIGGFSGETEPTWAKINTLTASQVDNNISWNVISSTSTVSSNQVLNLLTEELPQVHSPSLWSISTAIVRTNFSVPNNFALPNQTGNCSSCTPQVMSSPISDIALMITPYIFHHVLYDPKNKYFNVDGIDTESAWSAKDMLPEPFIGFGLNGVGSNYYAGLSFEFFRNIQFIYGEAWIKSQLPTSYGIGSGSSGTGPTTPVTYSGFSHGPFWGIAFNISGLMSGH
jgi:hypothetical protein